MSKILTYGLMASNAAMAAALPHGHHAHAHPSPEQAMRPPLMRRTTKKEQDDAQAWQLAKRDTPDVDWDAVDYDFSGVDWNTIDYGSPTIAAAIATPTSEIGDPMAGRTGLSDGQVSPTTIAPVATQAPVAALQATTPAAGNVAAAPTQAPAAPAQDVSQGNMGQVPLAMTPDYFAGIDATTNAIAIAWHGQTPMTFNFYADVAAFQPQFGDAYKSVTLQPNSYQTVTLPQGFSGRLQKMTGRVDEPATWAEVTFQGWKGMTFFDVSYIRGYDGPCVMKMVDNSAISGTQENFLGEAPADDRGTTSLGNPYLKATEGFDGSITSDLVSFYRNKVPTNAGYVRNFDDASSKASSNQHMIVSYW